SSCCVILLLRASRSTLFSAACTDHLSPFSLSGSAAPPLLSSSPTRRSSDLGEVGAAVIARSPAAARDAAELVDVDYEELDAVTKSEEHTSELQSRFDLVCRLLLEKKKNNREMTDTNKKYRS